jgi:uncharacterized protein YbbC (DUF1343 family)
MTRTGLDNLISNFPPWLKNKKVGIVCHAASVTADYIHIIDVFRSMPCTLAALFGPQHGMFGQTQDNMVEWEGYPHPTLKIPVYSLYRKNRKPTQSMIGDLDALVIDLQDVGARPYTYIWTIKLCMEACAEEGVPVWILDRPNPIAAIRFDGPMLLPEYFSFVGGAPIPLCHRCTVGEMGMLLKKLYFPSLDLKVIWMTGWRRNSLFNETGLPWVLPSPNMPTLDTAVVYPGMVLLEATNLSEGRGTTRPFEIIGAPFININQVLDKLKSEKLPGCIFREHGFIPTFQKWQSKYCNGLQVHVTNPRTYRPVFTTIALLHTILSTSGTDFQFKMPPYEYETEKMPFDILAGSSDLRRMLEHHGDITGLPAMWEKDLHGFKQLFKEIAHYPEE